MAASLTTAVKNAMLDAVTVTKMGLHSGDPGASGTSNEISGGGYARANATYSAAASAARALSADVAFVGTAATSVTWASLWNVSTFVGRIPLTGDNVISPSGNFTVTATGTNLTLTDPA